MERSYTFSMPFFEGKGELYIFIYLLVIPLLTSYLFYKFLYKLLWVSLIVSFILGILLSAVFFPFYFTDIFTNTYDSTTIYWMMFAIPIQFSSSLLFMGLFYFTHFLKARKKHNTL